MSADEHLRIYHLARTRYEEALLAPECELEDLLWLGNLALACARDYLYSLEAEVLCTLPPWRRTLVRLAGARRLLGVIRHYERAVRLLRGGVT